MARRLVSLLAGVTIGGSACGQSAGAPGAINGTITVLAAASLTAAFQKMARSFEEQHPGVKVEFSFAGSSSLAAQIQQGAPADVFASADQPNMQKLVDAGLVAAPKVFARNKLEIVVAAGNPKGISGLSDLARPGLVIVLCAPSVPCGRYAAQAFSKAGVRVAAASQESDVKAVVSKVALGEADAGIVYVTDVRAGAPKVQGVAVPDDENIIASYPIALLKAPANDTAASAFVDFVLSSDGGTILQGFGFLSP